MGARRRAGPTHPGTDGVDGPTAPPVEVAARPRSFAERVDSSAPGLYLCDPSDGQAVALYTEADARALLLTSAAMFRLRDARGGWTPWPA